MWAASTALKSLVHLDRALRIAVSASPAGCADTGVPAAISKNPHQASSRFTLSDLSGRLLQDIGDGGTPYNRGKIAGDPGMTRTCDLRFRKPPLYPAELRDHVSNINGLPWTTDSLRHIFGTPILDDNIV